MENKEKEKFSTKLLLGVQDFWLEETGFTPEPPNISEIPAHYEFPYDFIEKFLNDGKLTRLKTEISDDNEGDYDIKLSGEFLPLAYVRTFEGDFGDLQDYDDGEKVFSALILVEKININTANDGMVMINVEGVNALTDERIAYRIGEYPIGMAENNSDIYKSFYYVGEDGGRHFETYTNDVWFTYAISKELHDLTLEACLLLCKDVDTLEDNSRKYEEYWAKVRASW